MQKQEVVYVLISLSRRTFLIAHGTKESLCETYRHHLKLRRDFSKNFIESIAPERPCLFILEEIDPKNPANLLIVWLRILREKGFASFNSSTLIEYSEYLYIDNMMAYEQRKDTDLSEILCCNSCLIPTFKRKTCASYPHENSANNNESERLAISKESRKRTKEIRICVTEEEYETIRKCAEEANIQLSPYIRTVAMNSIIRNYDFRAVLNHTQAIGEIRNYINRLIYTIDARNNYLPKEIETLVNLMSEIFKSENCLLKETRNLD